MLKLIQRSSGPLLVVLVSLLLPSAAYAQAAITGVVKDASGAVLPGVTVEAASPVLIEKVRSVVTDATGQYRIVDLRPGTYTVTFDVAGLQHRQARRHRAVGELRGDRERRPEGRRARGNDHGDRRDADRRRAERADAADHQQGRPRRDSLLAERHRHPGHHSRHGHGRGCHGGRSAADRCRAVAASIHGGRANDSRIYADGINMGWAGSNGGGGNMPQVAAAQEVVMTVSGGLAEAETGGVVFNVIPRDGCEQLQRSVQFQRLERRAARQQLHRQALKAAGLRAPSELINVYDVNPMYGGRIVRDKLWFYSVFRQVGGERRCRACSGTRTPATRMPGPSTSTDPSRRSPTAWSARRRCG